MTGLIGFLAVIGVLVTGLVVGVLIGLSGKPS
jgi:hypothetical protein